MYLLSMDFGTTSIKMGILTRDLELIKTAKAEYRYRVYNHNWVELDIEDVIAAMAEGLKNLSDYLEKVEIVVFDTFSPSVVIMDREGEALYPIITHLDRRSKKQMKYISREIGVTEFQNITGIKPFIGGASVTSMLWLKENEPSLFNKAYKIGHFNTYVYHLLTGIWVTDPVNASMTGLFETIEGSGWSDTICKTVGIPEQKLPDIVKPGVIAGHLTRKAAQLTGLREGIPVAVGTNDAAAAQAGAGNTKAGDMLIVSGSSEMISILTDKAVVNDKYYLRRAAADGLWQIFAITASGLVIDWFRREFYKEMDETTFYREALPAAIRQYYGTKVRFAPYIAGDRQSLMQRTGAFTGLTLDSTREDLLVSILVGIHKPIITVIEISGSFLELNNIIKLTGGMVDEAFIGLKKKVLKGYDFEVIYDCHLYGNAVLAMNQLK
ncbi:MAG: FGGY-family carbohydrate kinase [Clostridiales bacterium]|jgi:sugar (pentulose or hexulose) kinase|nr:FGGY-family carbohydrate kinase [Clostridiales bacterium]